MRIEVNGGSSTAKALIGNLRLAGFVVNEGRPIYSITIQEADQPSITLDSVEGEFEQLAHRYISELADKGGVFIQRQGGNLDERALVITVPASSDKDKRAVEVGVLRAVLKIAHTPSRNIFKRLGRWFVAGAILLATAPPALAQTQGPTRGGGGGTVEIKDGDAAGEADVEQDVASVPTGRYGLITIPLTRYFDGTNWVRWDRSIKFSQTGTDNDVDVITLPPVTFASGQTIGFIEGTASGTITATGQSVELDVTNRAGQVSIQLTGIWTSDLRVQGTIDGTNWSHIFGVHAELLRVKTGYFDTNASNGIIHVRAAGLDKVRIRSENHTSGTVNVTMVSTPGTQTVPYGLYASDASQFVLRSLTAHSLSGNDMDNALKTLVHVERFDGAAVVRLKGDQDRGVGAVLMGLRTDLVAEDMGKADNSSYTDLNSPGVIIQGIFNDSATALTSGRRGLVRVTSNRAWHINFRNAAGTEIGTSTDPVRVDPTGTTTQPVSISQTSTNNDVDVVSLPNEGQQTMASSISVAIASDQSAVPVSQSGTWTVQPGNTANTTPWLQSTKTALTFNAPTSASVGVASGQVLASNASRKGAVFVNTSNKTISCSVGQTAVLNAGVTLFPGGAWTMNEYTFATGAVNCIASGASSNLSIQEMQ